MKTLGFTAAFLGTLTPARAADDSPYRHVVVIPFTIDQLFGSRPVIQATINGKPYRLVLHSNAGFYLQINHAGAVNVGATNLQHRGAYGISKPGKVSDLGRDDGQVGPIRIGDWTIPSARVSVFEVPEGGAQGMLGLPFLRENHAVVDFARRELMLSKAAPQASLALHMKQSGYSAHAMTRDPADGRYLVKVTVNGVSTPMVVSTVASVNLDTAYAARARLATGPASGSYGGPSGAVETVHETASPVSFQIGRWSSKPAKVTIEDTYAYENIPRPANALAARGGALGADFMIANGAVIDFGNAVVYLKG